jgi:putative ABC transport system substrate-binding protein
LQTADSENGCLDVAAISQLRQAGANKMQRRALISFVGAAAGAWPFISLAQPSRVARIGVLHVGNADAALFGKELREGLRELGYAEGKNIAFEFRSAEGKLSRLPELAAELVRLEVDVIVAFYTPCALAAKEATAKIPIVIVAGDPVETGLVASLARPGGNITGLSLMAAQLHGKCVELLRDMLPKIRRVAILANTSDPVFAKIMLDFAQHAGRSTGVEIQPVMTKSDEVEAAFSLIAKGGADAVVAQGSLPPKLVADLAIEHRLPAAAVARAFADAGGLLSYGADGPPTYRHSALFVHKILQGQNPGAIAVEQPTKFELAVNLKTANAIGISIPEPFMSRVDAVIE